LGFYKDYKTAIEKVRKDTQAIEVARARYMVQEDYNRELIEEIADRTGHPNLALTCFVDIDLASSNDLNVRVYNDSSVIDGIFSSNSDFHKSGGDWTVVGEHYGMHRDVFWDQKRSGERDGGSYGIVDPDWLADNFWDGVYWATNGWPRGNAEFLHSYKYHDVSAISVIKSYHSRYVRSNRFQKYIQDAINSMT
jgi:hypothetical protein